MRLDDLFEATAPSSRVVSDEELIELYPGIEGDLLDVHRWIKGGLSMRLTIEPMSKFAQQADALESTYPNFPRERKRTQSILRSLDDGAKPWPLFIDETDGFIMEGRHRIVAFHKSGLHSIPVVYVSKSRLDEISIDFVGDRAEGSFRKRDIELHHNEKARAKIARLWKTVSADFRFVLINKQTDPEMAFQWAYGHSHIIDSETAAETLGVALPVAPDTITVVMTNNEGDSAVPLTGWILAHRFYHIVQEAADEGDATLIRFMETEERFTKFLFQSGGACHRMFSGSKDGQHFNNALAYAIGTTKAARDHNLTGGGELYPEAFAQWLLTGKIMFKPIPKQLGQYWKLWNKTAQEKVQREFDEIVHQMSSTFEQIIDYAKGKVFVF